ncbi:hypothetical protein HID58_012666 [Brassica napus]|uniref:Uncharacterized protein n=1 Tax=Brassica napus TaxID=3708 RepID=A0ABQ8E1Q7_BRANA|nr:hypothetical protein HID58_012666 [Brassica napus]
MRNMYLHGETKFYEDFMRNSVYFRSSVGIKTWEACVVLTIPGVDPSSLDESESSDVKLKKVRAAVSTYREANESCCRQLKIEGDALECFSGTEKEIVKMIKTVMMMNFDCNRFSTYELWFELEKQHKLIHGVFSACDFTVLCSLSENIWKLSHLVVRHETHLRKSQSHRALEFTASKVQTIRQGFIGHMKLIDGHHLQQRPVLDMIMGNEIVGTLVSHSLQLHCFCHFSCPNFGLFLCRPNVQTHREGLVQLNVFLQIPEYSLRTRSADPSSIYLGTCFCFKNFPMFSFHLNNISCCMLAVHPNASELVNTSKITNFETSQLVR